MDTEQNKKTGQLNALIPIGIVADLVAVFSFWNVYDYRELLLIISGIWCLGPVGLFLIIGKKEKIGAWMVLVSSFLFVPLGLIAAAGAVKVLKRIEQDELDADD